jgi:hypothetical protein
MQAEGVLYSGCCGDYWQIYVIYNIGMDQFSEQSSNLLVGAASLSSKSLLLPQQPENFLLHSCQVFF